MIYGKRIYLRAVEQEDVPFFLCWFNDPEVTRYLGSPFPAISRADEERWVERLQGDSSRNAYVIVLLENDRPIGGCELRRLGIGVRNAELGIAIGEKELWGQGYGTEALELLLQIGFDGLGLHRIWLTVADFNERGIAAYKKCGFQVEGQLREDRFLDGRWHGTMIMAVLEQEWRERTAHVEGVAR